jgi:hypothetical protein
MQDIGKLASYSMPRIPDINITPNPTLENVTANHASSFRERLVEWIATFDKQLDTEYEVGVRLVNFGQTVVFHLREIGYWNPSLISFSGETDSGDPVELIQHVSQISILLMKLKRPNPEEPKQLFGFHAIHQGHKEQQSSEGQPE